MPATMDRREPWYKRIRGNPTAIVLVLAAAQLLDNLSTSSIVVNLPQLQKSVGYEFNDLQWIASAYSLALVGFLPIGGRLGDLYGQRRPLVIGVLVFAVWSFINGFARHPVFMSIGRAFQGAGVGLLIPNAMAMITTSYPVGRERIKALANLGGSGTTSSVVGFLLGGAVGTRIGWEWLFYLMAIYAVLVAGLCLWIIPPGLRDSDNSNLFNAQHASKRVDVLGMAMFVAGTVMIIYYLGESPDSGWAAVKTLPFLVAGVLLLVIFTVIEFKVPYPIVPPRIWASRRFTAAAASALFVNASGNIFSYFLSVFFQMVWNYEPMKTGISFIPSGIGMIISVELTTILLEYRVQSKILLLIGYALLGVSAILLTFMDESFAYWRFPFPALIVHAVGLGPVWVCTQVNAAADAHSSDQGIVASEYNMALQLGNPLGIALAIAFSDRVVSDVDEIQGAELVKAFRVAFYVAAAMAALGFLVTLFLAPNRDVVGIAERRDPTANRDDHDAIEMQHLEDNNITGSTAVAKPTTTQASNQ